VFKNLTIGKKLGIGFGVLIFLLLIFGGVTIIQLGIIKRMLQILMKELTK